MGHTPPFAAQRCIWTTTRCRPAVFQLHATKGSRGKATEAGDDDTGHIQAREREGIFFLDSTLPTSLPDEHSLH